tara:strand:- start:9347 stop:10537 length:1191 start_codon:yes stop_codon:yes gene_type:complete
LVSWRLPEEERNELISFRRELHQHPELSWQEFETSRRVFERLEALGLTPRRMAKTGVVAEVGSQEGPVVALRADLDALPIQEATDLPFASEHQGVMHACGHDAHTACLMVVAKRLVANPPSYGRVRLIFQPAEEDTDGADMMIREGVLADPEPIAIYGAHVWSQMPSGYVGVNAGPTMGSVDHLEIEITGRGGHGAVPHTAIDPIVAGANLVMSLQTLVSRRIDPMHSVVVSIGQFEAGTAFNVIPETAKLTGTVRTLEREAWEQIPALLETIVHQAVAAHGCEAKLTLTRSLRPLINHERETEVVRKVAQAYLPDERILPTKMLAGEDFSAFLEQIPGCFFFVGSAFEKSEADAMKAAPHHNPRFMLDEESFDLVVRILEDSARYELNEAHKAVL